MCATVNFLINISKKYLETSFSFFLSQNMEHVMIELLRSQKKVAAIISIAPLESFRGSYRREQISTKFLV